MPFIIEIIPIITTYVYPLPTCIVLNPILADLPVEEYLERYCNQRGQTPFIIKLRSNLDYALTSMDTINSSINRQFSNLPAYRLHQNASIWANTITEFGFNSGFDSFQSITNTKELRYYAVKSKCHAFTQLNEAIKETLSVFAQLDFNEERFMTLALENEHVTLLSLDYNPGTLEAFIKNSSDELRKDFN